MAIGYCTTGHRGYNTGTHCPSCGRELSLDEQFDAHDFESDEEREEYLKKRKENEKRREALRVQ